VRQPLVARSVRRAAEIAGRSKPVSDTIGGSTGQVSVVLVSRVPGWAGQGLHVRLHVGGALVCGTQPSRYLVCGTQPSRYVRELTVPHINTCTGSLPGHLSA
jgi:hypothetical protein